MLETCWTPVAGNLLLGTWSWELAENQLEKPAAGDLLLETCCWKPVVGKLLLETCCPAAGNLLEPAVGNMLQNTCCWRPAAGDLLLESCCQKPAAKNLLLDLLRLLARE